MGVMVVQNMRACKVALVFVLMSFVLIRGVCFEENVEEKALERCNATNISHYCFFSKSAGGSNSQKRSQTLDLIQGVTNH